MPAYIRETWEMSTDLKWADRCVKCGRILQEEGRAYCPECEDRDRVQGRACPPPRQRTLDNFLTKAQARARARASLAQREGLGRARS